MAQITFKENPVHTIGELPAVGSSTPNFALVAKDLSTVTLKDYSGKKLILNIFPSVDTGICAASVRQFNARAGTVKNTTVLCISKDLPFAQSRFCGAEGIENVVMLSDMNRSNFAKDYGLEMTDGPLANLLARAVIIIDEEAVIKYTQLVAEITQEPNYEAALKALS